MSADDIRRRHPLLNDAGIALHRHLLEHPDAPPWNTTIGDKLCTEDLPLLADFRMTLGKVENSPQDLPLERWRQQVPWVRRAAPEGRPWAEIPLCSRDVLTHDLVDMVPEDADYKRLIRYDTSGTSGSPIAIPSHPATVALNHTLIEAGLARWGIRLEFGVHPIGVHVCAQRSTFTFVVNFSCWGGGGFAKVNLSEREWSKAAARRFLGEMQPQLVTGDPLAFAELLAWEIPIRPKAFLSTATMLSPGLSAALYERYQAPVMDWYSTTETGPIAAADSQGLRLIAPDLYVEIVDAQGQPVPDGQRGEIVVSGGRNPYVPLLRYRTGDYAVKEGLYLRHFEGRRPVLYRAGDGLMIAPMDVARVLHNYVWADVKFESKNGFKVTLRPVQGWPLDTQQLQAELEGMLKAPVAVEIDAQLGAGKKTIVWND